MRNILKVAQIHALCNWMADRKSFESPCHPKQLLMIVCFWILGNWPPADQTLFSLAFMYTSGYRALSVLWNFHHQSSKCFCDESLLLQQRDPLLTKYQLEFESEFKHPNKKIFSKDCEILSFSEILALFCTTIWYFLLLFGHFRPCLAPFGKCFQTFSIWRMIKKNFDSDLMLYIKFQF